MKIGGVGTMFGSGAAVGAKAAEREESAESDQQFRTRPTPLRGRRISERFADAADLLR